MIPLKLIIATLFRFVKIRTRDKNLYINAADREKTFDKS